MPDSLLIPYFDPSSEVIEASPSKIIFEKTHIEVFCRYNVLEKNEDTGIKDDVKVDSQEVILKSHVGGFVFGRCVKHDCYVVHIYYLDRSQMFFFQTKSEAKNIYNKLYNWYFNANS